ncbi:hypothetical protein CBER1_05947 [Cercospora berteroae]|uniref:Beta-lactamase-like ARB-00930-like C-terminal domain-containing protein n=1 Tax=Cercospora berteroae TaxID=357750 RepID=A0A2S6CAM7_9PEZI|nr:hypothetical protein CBER1_05947 [Cercospora berteroae]
MGDSQLLSLPEELVASISEIVPVESIVNFALSCSAAFRHVEQRLEQSQRLHAEFKIQHDRRPLTSATLLRRAISDPDAVWHLRAFESWGVRPGFEKWKSWSYDRDSPRVKFDGAIEFHEDHASLDATFYGPSELVEYRMIMMDKLHMSIEEVYKWTERIRDGWDEPIKGMLFALAPRIDRLNFIKYDYESTEFATEDPLIFLSTAIRAVHDSTKIGGVWPPGFSSLRMVSICSYTDLRHNQDAFYASPSSVACLFLLPNIKVLNLSHVGHGYEDDSDYILPPGSWSVEALSFYLVGMTLQARIMFLRACRRLYCFRSAHSRMDTSGEDRELWRALSEQHSAWLECLSLEDFHQMLPEVSISFPQLKRLDCLRTTDWGRDSKSVSFGSTYMSEVQAVLAAESEEYDAKTAPIDLRTALPFTIERLTISRDSHGMSTTVISKKAMCALAELAEDERFTNLKEICLYEVGYRANESTIPSGGILSTLNDLNKLGVGILNHTLLSAEATRRWMKPVTHSASLSYSIGAPWEIVRYLSPSSGKVIDIYTKLGDSGSYSAMLAFIPEYNAGFSYLSGYFVAPGTDGRLRDKTAFGIINTLVETLMPALEAQAAREAEANFIGTYSAGDSMNSTLVIAQRTETNVTSGEGAGLYIEHWTSNGVDALPIFAG